MQRITLKLVVLLALAVVLCAACTFTQLFGAGKTVVAQAEKWLCNASNAQVEDAVAALVFFKDNPDLAAKNSIARGIFDNIINKICVTLPQVQQALGDFDQAVSVLGTKGASGAVPALKNLRAWVAQ